MHIHEKFQGFSLKNDWVIAIGLLPRCVTPVVAAGGMSVTIQAGPIFLKYTIFGL